MINRQIYRRAFNEIKHDTVIFGAKMRNHNPYNHNGHYNPGEIDGLIDLISYVDIDKSWKIVEIGSYYGASSVIFANTGASIDCIDPWSEVISDIVYDSVENLKIKERNIKIKKEDFERVEKLFDENIASYPNIKKIKANAQEYVNNYKDKSLDMVYIDANHNYEDVKKDIELWLPKVKKDGWICGHDFTIIGVSKAVTELFQVYPHTFKDSSWCIKKNGEYKNGINIYIGTGVTENYLEKAMKYLVSLHAFNNAPMIKKFCITLGFHAPAYLKNSMPTIDFIYKSVDSQIMANKNNCMQHGEFLSSLNAQDDDIIVFTDGDIIIQESLNVHQLQQIASAQDGEIYVSYNQNPDDTLFKEYIRLKTFDANNQILHYVDNEILEQLLEFNSMEYKCYNTGVMVANKKTYKNVFDKYCELFPAIDKTFGHYAKQQYLLCYVIQKYYKASILNKSIHTHGHSGIPSWAEYNFKTGDYELSAVNQGFIYTSDDVEQEFKTKIIFRHNLWNQKITIAILNAEEDGCGAAYYRITTPYKTLQKKYDYKYNVIPLVVNETNLNEVDIIVCQRSMNMELYGKIKNNMKEGSILVWDGDDDYYNVDDRNPHTNSFKDPKTMLGISSFVHNADLVTTSTEYLAGIYRKKRDGRIEIFPNGLDYKLWDRNYEYKIRNKKDDGYIRIGWQGGDSHTKDMRNVYNTLLRIAKEFDNVLLTIVGWDFTNYSEFLNIKDRIEHIGWAKFHERYVQNIINFDIGIAPLDQNMIFNKSKSNIKWLEYSALSIPTIASNELPYQEIINNETGIIIDNTEENWYNSIVELIKDRRKMNKLGLNAKKWTREKYDVTKLVDKMDKVYSELLNIK